MCYSKSNFAFSFVYKVACNMHVTLFIGILTFKILIYTFFKLFHVKHIQPFALKIDTFSGRWYVATKF